MRTKQTALILLSILLSSTQVIAEDHLEAPMISPTHFQTNANGSDTSRSTTPSKNMVLKGKKILQNAQPTPALEGRQKNRRVEIKLVKE